MNAEFFEALRQLERERELSSSTLLEVVQKAFTKAYQKSIGTDQEVNLRIEMGGGKVPFRIFRRLQVVETVTNSHAELTLSEARALKPDAQIGETIEDPLSERDIDKVGRIGAQLGKQVIQQSVRDAERSRDFDEYFDKIGTIETGTVSRREGGNVVIAFGKKEAYLAIKEQVPSENYRFNDRIKVFVLDVKNAPRGPLITVSRTHPSLIRRLFELEVPELQEGVVQIKSVAREAGQRSKIAVSSRDDRVDAVGACVGHRGGRVQSVVNELFDEKIDIVRWSADNRQFITESLSPAKVSSVQLDDNAKSAFVVVPDNQLSLAIGKAGQNVRLAARLTGWRIDIRSESQVAKQAFMDAAAQLASAPEDPEAEALLPPITFGDEDDDADGGG